MNMGGVVPDRTWAERWWHVGDWEVTLYVALGRTTL